MDKKNKNLAINGGKPVTREFILIHKPSCLLYTSDAADDLLCVDLGGRRILKKNKTTQHTHTLAHTTTYYTHTLITSTH